MPLQTVGQTPHFIVQYDDAIGPGAQATASAVLAICELDLARLKTFMPVPLGGAGDPFVSPPIAVNIVNDPSKLPGFAGAQNFGVSPGRQSLILINAFSAPNVFITADYAAFLFVAELAELLMTFYGWDAGSSQGEALSRVAAEELHPASSSNFVNSWLAFPSPRPDWISHNDVPGVSPLAPRGDLNPISYGCGIVFIYFLRYQLRFSYNEICGAGGSTLLDRYQLLTGDRGDPAARLEALLDAHFGSGPLNLVGNNPFPLLEGAERKVVLGFGRKQLTNQSLPGGGEAHVKAFFTCPAGVYPYTELGTSIRQTITATTVGIGSPVFTWRVNGMNVFGSRSGASVSVPVDVPDPGNPEQPLSGTQTFTFDYQVDTQVTAAGSTSTLTLTSRSFAGDYHLEIEASANEAAVADVPAVAEQGLTYRTRSVVYGGTYAADQDRCQQAFEKAKSRYLGGKTRAVQDSLTLIKNLPDPPPPGYLPAILQAAAHIREELANLAESDHPAAAQIARQFGAELGVPARVFLKGAHGAPVDVTSKERVAAKH